MEKSYSDLGDPIIIDFANIPRGSAIFQSLLGLYTESVKNDRRSLKPNNPLYSLVGKMVHGTTVINASFSRILEACCEGSKIGLANCTKYSGENYLVSGYLLVNVMGNIARVIDVYPQTVERQDAVIGLINELYGRGFENVIVSPNLITPNNIVFFKSIGFEGPSSQTEKTL